ncbi:MAG: hypothetical protein RLZZ292_2483 [Bacteroidota bacterium]|jgi:hypothetical protein
MRTTLLQLRPTISSASTENANTVERFQNETLRPILKFQHDLLMQVMKQNFIKRKNEFYKTPEKARTTYLEDTVRKDLRFKSLLHGIVIGHFTDVEYTTFTENEAELGRRITDLLVQRFQSMDFL